jgi:hypothetical protein
MDQGDQELLEKQPRRVAPAPRKDGTMILALVAVFLAGMTLGSFMFANKAELTRITSSDAAAATAQPSSALPIAR